MHWADYVIFVAFLLTSIVIGLYHAFTGGKQRTNEEFIMADRKLKIIPTAISVIVSYMSALTIVGGPSEMYSNGIMFWMGYIISSCICLFLVMYIIIPWIYPLKLTSIYSYFHLRYGNRVIQTYTASLGVLGAVVYTGVAIYAPSMTLETSTGFPMKASIPIMTAVCTAYTALGGIRAVIWTDVFQALVMMAGMFTILIKAIVSVGSVSEAFKVAGMHGRLDIETSMDPTIRHTLAGFIIGMPISKLSLTGFAQGSMQRYAALPDLKQAQMMQVLWLIGQSLLSSVSYLTGIMVFAYYAIAKCDPIASNQISSANQVIPLFVTTQFAGAPGFPGLFLATMYSATLSTVSSTLSGASANAWTDMIQPRVPNLKAHKAALVSKCLVICFGCTSMIFAFSMMAVSGSLLSVTISFTASCVGPVLGLFALAGLRIFRRISWLPPFIASLLAFVANMWVTMGAATNGLTSSPLPPASTDGCHVFYNGTTESGVSWGTPTTSVAVTIPMETGTMATGSHKLTGLLRFYSLSYVYYALFGCLVTVVIANIVHWLLVLCGKAEEPPKIAEELFTFPLRGRAPRGDYSEVATEKPTEVPLEVMD